MPGSGDADMAPDADLHQLQLAFLKTSWADRDPVEVEVPFELVIDDTVVRGRMDAVFRDVDGGFTVVDWKTGRRPAGVDARAAGVQLAALPAGVGGSDRHRPCGRPRGVLLLTRW